MHSQKDEPKLSAMQTALQKVPGRPSGAGYPSRRSGMRWGSGDTSGVGFASTRLARGTPGVSGKKMFWRLARISSTVAPLFGHELNRNGILGIQVLHLNHVRLLNVQALVNTDL